MRTKKTLSLLLTLCFLLSLVSIPAAAQEDDEPTLSADHITAMPGESALVEFAIANNPGIAGLQIIIGYESDVLTVDDMLKVDIPDGAALSRLTPTLAGPDTYNKNPFITNWFGTRNDNSNGKILYIDYTVKETAPAGKHTITLVCDENNTVDQNGTPVAFTTVDGSVTIWRNLSGITAPQDISVRNGTAKTAEALRLPETVSLDVDNGVTMDAEVTWDIGSVEYDPSLLTEQSFTVAGTVTLPDYITNEYEISLTTSVDVTVNAKVYAIELSAPDFADTAYGSPITAQALEITNSSEENIDVTLTLEGGDAELFALSPAEVAVAANSTNENVTVAPKGTLPAGDYEVEITAAFQYDGSDESASDSFSLTITPKALSITGATATKVYDGAQEGTVPVTGGSLAGIVGEDDVTLTGIPVVTLSETLVNAGNYANQQVSGYTLGGADKDNYTLTQPTVTLTITPATATYAIADQNIKTGNGTSAIQKPDTARGVSNESVAGTVTLYKDDDGATVLTDAHLNALAVGAKLTVDYAFVSSNTNYNADPITGSFEITITELDPQTLSFAEDAVEKTYGDEAFAIEASNDITTGGGVISYESSDISVATVNAATGEVTILDVGKTTITATAAAVPGMYAEGSASYELTINAKTLSVTGIIAADRDYDGTRTVAISGGSLTGIVGEDEVSPVIPATGETEDPNAGEDKAVTLAEITLEGADIDKYTVTQPTGITVTITPKALTITDAVADDKTYDGETDTTVSSVSFEGFIEGETLMAEDYTAAAEFADSDAGEDKTVTVTVVLTVNNYTLPVDTFETTATIRKAPGAAIEALSGGYTGDGTHFTYTLDEIEGAEYSTDDETWQDGPVFGDIEPLSELTFYARMKETKNYLTGASTSLTVVFVLLAQEAPELDYSITREKDEEEKLSVTLTITTVEGAEYSFDGGENWSSENSAVFDPEETESVDLAIRMKATATHEVSEAAARTVNIRKGEQEAPEAFTLSYEANGDTDYTVTIPEVEGCEYSFDGESWSQERSTQALPSETVTGYMRKAETDDLYASPATQAELTLPLFTVKTPAISPEGSEFRGSITVTITCDTQDAEIYYTLDGSGPDAQSDVYTEPLELTDTATVKAIAIKEGMTDSEIASATYTLVIDPPIIIPPVTTDPEETETDPWTKAEEEITEAAAGSTVTTDLEEDSLVPASVLDAAKGKDITLEFKAGDFTWNVNGKDIGDPGDKAIDLGVSAVTDEALSSLADDGDIMQLELAHEGDFPFEATLSWNVGTEYAGTTVYLYYHNPQTKALELYAEATVDKDGYVSFTFTHASRYVLTASELPSPAGTRISQPASSLTLVPYYIADGKEILIKMSGIQDGKLVFTSPAKALYQYKDNAKTFADVPQGFWGTDAIRFVTAREIFNGLGDSIFSPDTGMTRAMFTRVLANIEGINTDSYKTSAFDDVDINAWYSGTVAWAAEMGIVNGIGNGLFAPDQEITREQMAVMLYNYMQWKGIELSGSTPEAFSDSDGISTWATDAVMEMRRAGIINGVGDNRYDPKGTATRAQVATIFMNFVNAAVK